MKTYKAGYQSVPKLLRKKFEFSNFLYFYPRHSQSNWIAVELSRTQSLDWVRQLNQIELSLLLTFIKIGVRGAEMNNR